MLVTVVVVVGLRLVADAPLAVALAVDDAVPDPELTVVTSVCTGVFFNEYHLSSIGLYD
jgi:hypothetical protein